jgi:hypothetical protein
VSDSEENVSTRFLSGLLIYFASFSLLPNVRAYAPIQNARKRAHLARLYAPEIRQDKKEAFGFASIPWFLQHSLLMMQMRACGKMFPSLRKGQVWPLLPGTSLLYGRYFSVKHPAGCQLRIDPFASRPRLHKGKQYLAAPNQLFLQLRNHHPRTLLTGRYKRLAAPEWNYHVYQAMGQRCLRKGWLRNCKKYEHRRFYVIQYFVPLMLNNACNVHEGEMEGMTILVDRTLFDAARTTEQYRKAVYKVAYAGHYENKLVKASKVTFVHGTHPVAYMGRGGHALYPKAGVTPRLKTYAVELRRLVKRTCRKRKRLWGLTEWHQGGGEIAQGWKPLPALSSPWKAPSGCQWVPWLGKQLCLPARQIRLLRRNNTANRLFPFQSTSKQRPTTRKAGKDPVRQSPRLQSKKPLALTAAQVRQSFHRELSVQDHATLRRIKALRPGCVLRLKRKGVRLCDVYLNKHDSDCCISEVIGRYRRWVYFAGRWGKQEAFANSLAGKTAGRFGRYFRRWPLGQSMGNSGPFGPPFIFATTWRWYNPLSTPKPTPPQWR